VLLLKFFALIDAEAKPHIPDRKHGYSFNQASARRSRGAGSSS